MSAHTASGTRTPDPHPSATPPAAAARRRPAVPGAVVGRLSRLLGSGITQALLVIVALVWLTPTVGLFVSSLRSSTDSAGSGWWTALAHPGSLTFGNYSRLLSNSSITHAFWNTVYISVPTTVAVVVLAALAGYAFAWLEFPGRDGIFLVVVALLVVPLQIALLPLAKLFGTLGIFGTLTGVVLFHVAYGLPFAVFLLRNYFAEIPREMLEAARMDGGNEWTVFLRVVLPVGRPAIASLAIFQFLWVWNDLLVGLIFADAGSQPLTVALQSQMRQFGSNIDILAPGAFLSLIVPLAVFFAFQRHFVEGVMAGSVK